MKDYQEILHEIYQWEYELSKLDEEDWEEKEKIEDRIKKLRADLDEAE